MFSAKNFFPILLVAVVVSGCGKQSLAPKTPVTLTQAQEQFLKICRDELKYDVYVIPKGRSMWVYVPLKNGIIDFRASPKDQTPKAPSDKGWSIAFLESLFDPASKTFTVSYDIAMAAKYDKPATYQNKYSDEYSTKQREILTSLTRAYFDVGQKNVNVPLVVGDDQVKVGDTAVVDKMTDKPFKPVKETTPPEFFVMVLADTQRGVGIRSMSYFDDMKMALSNPPALTNEEYAKRYVYELFGDETMIGDKTGAHLNAKEIALGDFLAKQIENRIKYEFTQSSFPPGAPSGTGDNIRDEVWDIVAETCRAYHFQGFEKIKLIDLQTKQESTYDRSQL